ncbi:MAG: primosomal protein N', partial [Chloroflexota bacterium]
MPTYVQIVVNVPHVKEGFDYHLPPELEGHVRSGHLVSVPFGRQIVQGIVLKEIASPLVPQTKAVIECLDPDPVITPQQLGLAQHISQSAFASLAACLELMLPPGLSKQAQTLYRIPEGKAGIEERILQSWHETQRRLYQLILERGEVSTRQIDHAMPRRNWRLAAQKLSGSGLITSKTVLPPPSVRAKVVRTAQLTCSPVDAETAMLNLAKAGTKTLQRRQAMLRYLMRENGAVDVSWLYAESAANGEMGKLEDLREMEKRGLILLSEDEVWRDPLTGINPDINTPPDLTKEQKVVWEAVKERLTADTTTQTRKNKPILLHGVTGSGKTEIYLRAVEETLRLGKQAIVLVPEIALTPQTVRRFMARFPGKVGLVHSRLSDGERYDTWRRARSGLISLVVGPRSALFTPFHDLGLIVVDEFHDGSYYQGDLEPFYHASSAACEYARLANAVILLGSATPDLVSYYRARQGHWQLLHLPDRILGHRALINAQSQSLGIPSHYHSLEAEAETIDLPPVQVIDMRRELKSGNRSMFSRPLHNALKEVLEQHRQAILFLNRRGMATYVFCRECGLVLKCPHCDIPLTYHDPQYGEDGSTMLRCHTCNYERKMPKTCPECGSTTIRQFGAGTQKVETEVKTLFPQARVLRWDWDTTRQKGAHEMIMNTFASHGADILIGTQMLAKGLDLPLVTLVGVVLADVGLNLPDYRSGERVFQTLMQVAGRAGRSILGGQVILQTYQPDHYVIQTAAEHDFNAFYEIELKFRSQQRYPPFARLVRLELRDKDAAQVEENTRHLAGQILDWIEQEGRQATQMIGPAPCFFSQVDGLYRWQIILRGPDPASLLRGR